MDPFQTAGVFIRLSKASFIWSCTVYIYGTVEVCLILNLYIYILWKGYYIDEKEVIQRTEQFEME